MRVTSILLSSALAAACVSDDDGGFDASVDSSIDTLLDGSSDGSVPMPALCEMELQSVFVDLDTSPTTTSRPLVPISGGIVYHFAYDADNETSLVANDGTIARTLVSAGQRYTYPDDFEGTLVLDDYTAGPFTAAERNEDRLLAQFSVRASPIETRRFVARLPHGDLSAPGTSPIDIATELPATVSGVEVNRFLRLNMDRIGELFGVGELAAAAGTVVTRQREGEAQRIVFRSGDVVPSPAGTGVERFEGFSEAISFGTGVWMIAASVAGGLVYGLYEVGSGTFRCMLGQPGTPLTCARTAELRADVTFSLGAFAYRDGFEIVSVLEDATERVLLERSEVVGIGTVVTKDSPGTSALCPSTDDLYYVGNWSGAAGNGQDVFVQRRDGSIEQVTHFATRFADDPDFRGPDEIAQIALNRECDVLMSTFGPDNYAGVWSAWSDGTLARVVDVGAEVEVAPGDRRVVSSTKMSAGTNVLDTGFGNRVSSFDDQGNVALVVEYAGDGSRVYGGILRASRPADLCRTPGVVNTVGDASDLAPGDGECDTGASAPNGDPECTLRAAIEEANARPGNQSIEFAIDGAAPWVIAPGTELPPIADDLILDAADVVLEGTGGVALDVAADLSVSGLTVRGFDTAFAASGPLSLEGVVVEDVCRWGVISSDRLTMTNSRVQRAGTGSGCAGGGILSNNDDEITNTRLTNVELLDNGGPGILAAGPISIHGVTIERNDGPGIASATFDVAFRVTRVRFDGGRSRIAENAGPGIYIEFGDLRQSAGSFEIVDNESWGVLLEGGQAFFGGAFFPDTESLIRNNGVIGTPTIWRFDEGEPEQVAEGSGYGGGVLIETGDALGELELPSIFSVVRIEANDGPGILSDTELRLDIVIVADNLGDGVVVAPEGGILSGAVTSAAGGVIITGNRGHGIRVSPGGIDIGTEEPMPWVISDNGGWGIWTENFPTYIQDSLAAEPVRIERNGSGVGCRFFDLLETGPSVDETVCGGGGVAITGLDDEGVSSTVRYVIIKDNQGPGVLATDAVTLSRATIEGNVGDGIAVIPESTSIPVIRLLDDNSLIGNLGRGAYADAGDVRVTGVLTVDDNAGWGIELAFGALDIVMPTAGFSVVRRNGDGPTCWRWVADPVLMGASEACSGGGVRLLDGDMSATQLSVRDHAGTGIDVTGDLSINTGRLCNNGTDTIVSGTETLSGIDTVCP